MILKSIRHTSLLLLASASLALTGCINDAGLQCPPGEPSVVLRLSVDTGMGGATRTDKGNPDRFDAPNGDFETVNTLRVIIVHNLNSAGTQGRVEANRFVRTNEQGAPMFDNLEFQVFSEERKRIFLIANEAFLTVPEDLQATYKTATQFLDSFTEDKFLSSDAAGAADLTALANWTVEIPTAGNPLTATSGIFNPATSTSRLPLTESFDLYLTREKDKPDVNVPIVMAVDDICHANLFMTRAAAKAKFFITGTSNFSRGTTITAISLSGISCKEYVFPNSADYSPTKEELIKLTPNESKPDENKKAYITSFAAPQADTITYMVNKLGLDNEGWQINQPDGTALTNTLYFPESMAYAPGKKFWVGVELNGQDWIYAPLETNILSVGGTDAIARGTYLPITIEFKGTMQIVAKVLPWTPEYYYFDFSDHVGMANDGALSFLEGTYAQNGFDKTTARLVLPNYPAAASGSFCIGSPVGHTWDAYIITTQGEQNAIQFVVKDIDGNTKYTDHISGKVGEVVNFQVASTMSAGSEQREAIMQVMVSLDYGGITVPVNVLEGGSYGEGTENITFIQNAR